MAFADCTTVHRSIHRKDAFRVLFGVNRQCQFLDLLHDKV